MSAEIEGGATLWARQTIESEIFLDKPDKWFKIWFYLVNRVSHKDTKRYKRGETFYHQEWICDATGASPDQVKKCLAWLRDTGMISTRRSTRGTWLEIPKYSHFQRLDNYYQDVKAPDEARQKHERSTTEAPRYYKNDKNDKKQDSVEILKNSIPGITTGDDYEADNDSPLDKIKIKRQLERSLGLKKSSKWGEFIYGTGNDFLKAYEYFTGEKYEGNVILDEVAKNLAGWYARGETRDTIQDMITAFFGSEKAKKITVTPKSVFSDHTYNSWKQKKL